MEQLATANFETERIKWEPYQADDKICSKFTLDQWNLAVADIYSDLEWRTFLLENPDFICCKILKEKATGNKIGFIYIMLEDEEGKIVSIHGGGWRKNVSFLYYDGFFCIIKSLLKLNIKVRTSCSILNKNALRFIKSSGFVNYYTSSTMHYFWINLKRLDRNKIYLRLNKF